MRLTIIEAQNYDKKKDGNPILDNRGKQKFRSVIKTQERPGEYLTGFGYKALQPGEVIEAEVKIVSYNGQDKLEFQIVPSTEQKAAATQGNSDVLSELKTHTVLMKEILNKLEGVYMSISTHQTIEALKKPREEVVGPEDFGFPEGGYPEMPEALKVGGEEDYGM